MGVAPTSAGEPLDPGTKPTEPSGSVGFSDDNGHVFEVDIEWLVAEDHSCCNPPINDRFCPTIT